jgi:hypothetical protein
MAFTINGTGGGIGGSGAGTGFSTQAITYTKYNLYIINFITNTSLVSSVTVNGQTATQIGVVGPSSNGFYTYCYYIVPSFSGSFSASITLSTTVSPLYFNCGGPDTITGADPANPIVQSSTIAYSVISPVSITLGAFASANNVTYAAWGGDSFASATTITDKAGWSLSNNYGTISGGFLTQHSNYILANDTSPNVTFAGGTLPNVGGIAFELKLGGAVLVAALVCNTASTYNLHVAEHLGTTLVCDTVSTYNLHAGTQFAANLISSSITHAQFLKSSQENNLGMKLNTAWAHKYGKMGQRTSVVSVMSDDSNGLVNSSAGVQLWNNWFWYNAASNLDAASPTGCTLPLLGVGK